MEEPRYLKRRDNGIVIRWSEILSKRSDLNECDKVGNLLDSHEPEDDELKIKVRKLEAEIRALKTKLERLSNPKPESVSTLEECGDDRDKLLVYAKSRGIEVDKRMTAERIKAKLQ